MIGVTRNFEGDYDLELNGVAWASVFSGVLDHNHCDARLGKVVHAAPPPPDVERQG